MIKLELDWAANDKPETGVVFDEDGVRVVVEYDATPGPAGWPIVRVFVSSEREAFRASMALDAWLRDAYGVDDDDREDLASLAIDA